MIKVPVVLEINSQRISDLVISAVEGGSNYWANIEIFDCDNNRLPGLGSISDGPDGICGKCRIVFIDCEDEAIFGEVNLAREEYVMDTASRGLEVMAEKYPWHFANFLAENDDAETADVFVQCVCFNELIYG